MPEDTEEVVTTLDKGMSDLVAARMALVEPPDDEVEEAASLQASLRVIRRFYGAFFREAFGIEVDGFGWEAKHDAVRGMMEHDEGEDDGRLEDARLAVGFLFEDICDDLHGEVDFGYTDDIDVLRTFAREYLDVWAELVFDWLTVLEVPTAASLRARYEELKA